MDYKSIIFKVLEGNASPFEQEYLKNWVTLEYSNQEEFQNIKTLWDNWAVPNKSQQEEILAGLANIKKQIYSRSAANKILKPSTGLLAFTAGLGLSLFLIWVLNKKSPTIPYLKLNNTAIRQVIQTLHDHWNVTIEVDNKQVLECEFTGTFYNLPAEDVIRTIAGKLGLSLEIDREKKYTLKGTGFT